jgi:hypothetical protein
MRSLLHQCGRGCVVAGLALPACDAEALNLLVNGDFLTDFSGWTITDTGQNIASWTSPAGTPPYQGSTVGGSLNLTAFQNSTITASQCVAIAGEAISASVLVFSLVTAGPASAQVAAFGSGDCSGEAVGTVPLTPMAPSGQDPWWTVYQTLAAPLPGETGSVRFEIAASDGANNSDGDYVFDAAQLQAVGIFEDGFEIGPGVAAD